MSSSSRFCGKCGYELLGLPPTGKCPECGNPYSLVNNVGVVTESDGQRSARRLRRVRTLALAAAAVLVLVCGVALSFLVPSAGKAMDLGIFGAVVLLLAAVTSKVYENG